jgi:hypothetical protein
VRIADFGQTISLNNPEISKELTLNEIIFKVNIKHKMPDILKFVLPSARELRTDYWAEQPDDDEIVDRLKEIKFKVIRNVNSAKLWAFVKEIEGWESHNSPVPQ